MTCSQTQKWHLFAKLVPFYGADMLRNLILQRLTSIKPL